MRGWEDARGHDESRREVRSGAAKWVDHSGRIPTTSDASGACCCRAAIRSRQPCCTRAPQYAGPQEHSAEAHAAACAELGEAGTAAARCTEFSGRGSGGLDPRRCRPCSCRPTTGFRRSRPVYSTTSRRPAWSTSDGSIAPPSGGGFSRGASGHVIARSHCWEMLSHCDISTEHIDGCPPHASTSRAVSTSPHYWSGHCHASNRELAIAYDAS